VFSTKPRATLDGISIGLRITIAQSPTFHRANHYVEFERRLCLAGVASDVRGSCAGAAQPEVRGNKTRAKPPKGGLIGKSGAESSAVSEPGPAKRQTCGWPRAAEAHGFMLEALENRSARSRLFDPRLHEIRNSPFR
jgi:hypothetical protein